jgi:hypothetical protein
MLNDGKKQIRGSGDFRTVEDLAVIFGFGLGDLQARLRSWVARREIFSIDDGSTRELFPVFAFDPACDLRPNDAVAEVLDMFGNVVSPWFIAGWFIAVNSYLDGQRPKDLLGEHPEWVIEAARDGIRECAHG